MRKPLAALFVALTFLAACEVLSPAVAQPTEPRIVVIGDSVTEQAYGYLGGWQDAPSSDVVKVSGSGWDLDDAEGPYAAAIADGVDITVLALGPNDADPATGGWTLYDVANFHDFLGSAVPSGSCVVVELPRHKSGFPAAWATELNEARDSLLDLASPGGSFAPPAGRYVVMQDWRMRTATHPEFLASDGIHLAGNAAATERQQDYWDGAARCPALGGGS
jgi:hypothetical protein